MKRLHSAIACVALVLVVLVAINWHRIRIQANAQEPSNDTDIDPRAKSSESSRVRPGTSNDREYPTYFVDDVIERLTTSTEKLIEKKLTKNSDELRKEIDRTSFPVMLSAALAKVSPPQELYRRAAESVFLVAGLTKPVEEQTAWQTAFSTAFVVHEDGILSTSAHVFDHDDHDDAVVVMDVSGRVHPVVEILAADRQADTCLFRIGTKGLKPLPLGPEAFPGSPIRVMGHPGDSFFFFSAGHIANYEHDEEGLLWMNVTADFGQGSSGGPVMDEAGNVVGQVSRTYTLFAGGEASRRRRQPRTARQIGNSEPSEDSIEAASDDRPPTRKHADPQMVFKACTPVSAIRALVK